MKLRYILGRSGSGKTSLIYKNIKDELMKNSDKKLILLVPEQFTLQTEYELISSLKVEGIMSLEVLSFGRLAYKVLNEVGGIRKTTVNELGKIMILKRLFDIHQDDLNIYKKASKQNGFLADFSKFVSELKKNDIHPLDLNQKIDSFNEESILKKKIQDISFMYNKFDEYMKDRYTDEDDKFNLFIEKLDESEFLNGCEIWVDSFYGFTAQQYRIIEKLINKAERVNITLTYDKEEGYDKDLFIPTEKTYEKLKEIALNNEVDIEEVVLNEKLEHKNNELVHLEKQINSYPFNKYSYDINNIKLFSGLNPFSEVERIAAEIVSLVREKNYRWRDIIVVTGSIENYSSIVKKVFNEYEIPYFIDEKRNIMNNLIIKLIMSTLAIVSRNFKYEDVFRFIKTGFSDLNKEELEILENYTLRYGIFGNKWFEDFKYGEEDLDKVNEIRVKFITPFIKFKEKLKNSKSVSDITKDVFEFLIDIGIEEKLNDFIEELKDRKNFEYVNENTQIWNIVIEVFDQIVEILGDKKMNIKEYMNVLESGYMEYKIGIIPPTIDQVLVGNIERSKSHSVKALFVIGVNDGVLPSGLQDKGIILDDEKQVMLDLGLKLSSDSESRSYEERFSIYTMFSKPTEYLWISYALSDSEGKSLRPSILIDRFKSIYPKINLQSDIIINDELKLNYISKPTSTFKYLIESLREFVEGGSLNDTWRDVYGWYYNNSYWEERLKHAVEGLFHDNHVGYINENLARSLYDVPFRSSISRLEKFINCPFSHFINYGLKPEERKEYKVRTPDVGRLFHLAVERFSKKIQNNNIDWKEISKNQSDSLVEEIVDDIIPDFQNNVLDSTHRYKYLVKKLKRISKRAVWILTEHLKNGEFTPLLHEYGFGDGNYDAPPMIIELPNGEEIRLEGRIDRIDILNDDKGNFVKIIDYKSGSKKFSLSDVYYGLQIQLVVYLDAVLNDKSNFIKDELHPGGIFYFKIDDPMIKADDINEDLLEEEIMKKLKMDGIIVKDIDVIKAMDNSIESKNSSNIIPVSLKKSGEISKTSSVIEEKELGDVINHVKTLISEVGVEILKGNVKIEPCKTQQVVTCDYCQFISICQFDNKIENNKYKNLKKLKDNEALDKIKDERGEIDA